LRNNTFLLKLKIKYFRVYKTKKLTEGTKRHPGGVGKKPA